MSLQPLPHRDDLALQTLLESCGSCGRKQAEKIFWVQRVLTRTRYEFLPLHQKTVVVKFIMSESGYSRAQLGRFVLSHRQSQQSESVMSATTQAAQNNATPEAAAPAITQVFAKESARRFGLDSPVLLLLSMAVIVMLQLPSFVRTMRDTVMPVSQVTTVATTMHAPVVAPITDTTSTLARDLTVPASGKDGQVLMMANGKLSWVTVTSAAASLHAASVDDAAIKTNDLMAQEQRQFLLLMGGLFFLLILNLAVAVLAGVHMLRRRRARAESVLRPPDTVMAAAGPPPTMSPIVTNACVHPDAGDSLTPDSPPNAR